MTLPFHTYIIKTASRCNLNCTYCFVYNQADTRWRIQPRLMTAVTAKQIMRRIRQHCEAHNKSRISIAFHGGEPLLGGVRHLEELLRVIEEVFHDTDIKLSLGMQSNGLLFNREIGDLFLTHGMTMGISLDGPPDVNDVYRIDHRGRPSTLKLEEKLSLLTSEPYHPIFSGFLTVINPYSDPLTVFEYLQSFRPPKIDFLFPYDNYDRRPPGKENLESTPYADWLIKIFDVWFHSERKVPIRIFESFLRVMLGGSSLVESVGLDPVDLIVVETNGEIEAVDSLKATFDGATQLGYNVFDHDFDNVLEHPAVRGRQEGANPLCGKCKECPILSFCGGGYIPNRYSSENGFNNPSVYCADLDKLIRHIYASVSREFARDASHLL